VLPRIWSRKRLPIRARRFDKERRPHCAGIPASLANGHCQAKQKQNAPTSSLYEKDEVWNCSCLAEDFPLVIAGACTANLSAYLCFSAGTNADADESY
jgi:hypothetical protein